MANSKFFYFPIETAARELDSKLLLSLQLASSYNATVYVGSKTEIYQRLKYYPPGLVLEKTIQGEVAKTIALYKKYGHKSAVLCEEGLMFFSPEDYANRKLSAESVDLVDYIFCWGDIQRSAIIDRFPNAEYKCIVTGNPRMDLCGSSFYEKNPHYGSHYILLNTKFARTNYIGVNYLDNQWVNQSEKKGFIPNKVQRDLMVDSVKQESEILKSFSDFVETYDSLGINCRLVVRPHPAENIQYWKDLAKNQSLVDVVQIGESASWIKGAEAVISNNCTSSVESHLLETISINYRSYVSDHVEYPLPKLIGHQVHTKKELVHLLYSIVNKKHSSSNFLKPDDSSLISPFFKVQSLDNTHPLTVKLADSVKSMPIKSNLNIFFVESKYSMRRFGRMIKNYFRATTITHRKSLQKYPPVRKAEISSKFARMQEIISLDKGSATSVKFINPHLYLIS